MFYKQWLSAARPGAAILAALVIAGCANPRPAPVVNRTNTPVPQAGSPLPVPGQPLPAEGQPGQVAGQPPGDQPQGVQVSPIRSGGIESGAVGGATAPADPNLKTGPKGLKRPYGEMAAAEPRGTAIVVPAPAVVPTTAAPSITAPPLPPAAPPAAAAAATAGGTGMLEGVAFAWPAGGTVLQNFSETSSKGLWLGGKTGDVVRSAADGRVIFSGAGPRGYGNLIIVKHDNELLSVYAHNRSLAVKEGEAVKRGQKIAELGNSGTDKPKLHFEIRQQGKPIDPLAVLPRR
jgi:lipoprotein NlpD